MTGSRDTCTMAWQGQVGSGFFSSRLLSVSQDHQASVERTAGWWGREDTIILYENTSRYPRLETSKETIQRSSAVKHRCRICRLAVSILDLRMRVLFQWAVGWRVEGEVGPGLDPLRWVRGLQTTNANHVFQRHSLTAPVVVDYLGVSRFRWCPFLFKQTGRPD